MRMRFLSRDSAVLSCSFKRTWVPVERINNGKRSFLSKTSEAVRITAVYLRPAER